MGFASSAIHVARTLHSVSRYFLWVRGFANEYKNAISARRTEINDHLRQAKKSGATQLLAWLGIEGTDIERALKDCFLVQAQDWHWQDFHTTARTMPLWRALQAQIGSVVEWLVLVTGNEPVHYLDKHRYSHMGQDVWAQLEDVLEYPLWKAARSASKLISEIGQRYVNGKFPRAKDFVISPVQLVEIGRSVIGFDSYVEAMGRLLDESTHKDNDDPYRPRSRASWYRIIAITSDSFLRKAKGDEEPNGIKGLVNALGASGDAWELQMKGIEKKQTNHERMTNISALIVSAKDDDEMIIGFSLALHFTRHSTAHDNGLEFDWLNAEWAGPIFDSLVFFVPWALAELRKRKEAAGRHGM